MFFRYVDKTTGRDVLAWAASLGRDAQINTILELCLQDINILRPDRENMTSIHHAVISGNIRAVQALLIVCNKYRLNIDLGDNKGLTPYIYARKLGYHDIAELLVTMGAASPFQFDDKMHRSATMWETEGMRERLRNAKKELAQQKLSRRIGGQCRNKVKTLQLPTIIITGVNQKSYVLDLEKVNHFKGRSLRDMGDRGAHGVRPWERVPDADRVLQGSLARRARKDYNRAAVDSAVTLLTLAGMNKSEVDHPDHFVQSEFDESKAGEYEGITMPNIHDYMQALSDQTCGSFRKTAVPPKVTFAPRPPPPRIPRAKVSSLAILLGKDEKSRLRSARMRSMQRARQRGGKSANAKKTKKNNNSHFLPSIHAK